MMSLKSILVRCTLFVLDFYIGCLLLVVHCLNFIQDYLRDGLPVNQVVPLVEQTCTTDTGMGHKDGGNVVDVASTMTMDDPSAGHLPPAELQIPGHPPSPSSSFTSIPASPNEVATTTLTSPRNLPSTSSAPGTHPGESPPPLGLPDHVRNESGPGTDFRRPPYQIEPPWDAFDAYYGGDHFELQLIVPCWNREGVVTEGSTCRVTNNPDFILSPFVYWKVVSRAKELFRKFCSDKDTALLERASHILDHVLAVSHPDVKVSSDLLSLQALILFQWLNDGNPDASILDKSIDGLQAALSLVPGDAPHRHEDLSILGTLLAKRHDKKGSQDDLNQAIEAYTEALDLWPHSGSRPLELIGRLGTTLVKRYETGRDTSDIENAIRHLDGLLSAVDDDHSLRPYVLRDIGAAFLARCNWTGSMTDVERAIHHLQEALLLPTAGNQDRPGILHNLATAYDRRYDISGRILDLDNAIRFFSNALDLTNDDPRTLNNLSNSLFARYRRTKDPIDLGQAIHHIQGAISLLSHDDPIRPRFLSNLAIMLPDRFVESKDVADLDKAIDILEETLRFQPGNDPKRPSTLHNLSTVFAARYFTSKNDSDKKRVLDCQTESLSLIPPSHPRRHTVLLSHLFTQSMLAPWHSLPARDLQLVLDQSAELAKLTSRQHPEYSQAAAMIASALLASRHKQELDIHQLLFAIGLDPKSTAEDAALVILERGSKASASPSIRRLRATCDWIQLCQALNRPCTLHMFAHMFDLLDLSVARSCSIEIRYKELSTNVNIPPAKRLLSEAVATALEQGAIATAVEFIERGQSILLAQLSRYRSSPLLDALCSVRPDLAGRFRDLSWQAEQDTFTMGQDLLEVIQSCPSEDPISRLNKLKADWEDVVQQIRALDGFDHFLRPTPFPILQQAATEGPVILVNINESRSDAIIVTPDRQPLLVPLPFATPDHVDRLVSTFNAAPQSMSNRKALEGLRALWDTIVEPVVTELQDTLELPKNSRIWWCPTSSAISLPLHAAGLYQLKGDNCPLTRNCLPALYVSSYTPSLEALIHARQNGHHHSGLPNVLLVGQPNTPGQNEIPAVREEIRLIKKRIPHAKEIMGECGTHDAVLSGVVQHQWIHLSCHGHVQSDDPFQSHFVLHDGRLRLLEIMQQRLPAAEFAFLSACHSASGDSNTPDEFLHLAAGMQFAGFRSVVGTMWAMADYAGPPLADEFYRKMFPKRGKVDHTMAAQALHGATKKLWKDEVPLAVWINFVHWGA